MENARGRVGRFCSYFGRGGDRMRNGNRAGGEGGAGARNLAHRNRKLGRPFRRGGNQAGQSGATYSITVRPRLKLDAKKN